MKRIAALTAALLLALTMAPCAFAEDYEGDEWNVTFTPDARMTNDFTESVGGSMSETIASLQPGDSATFHMEIKNNHLETTDWYMTNEVIQSLEETDNVENAANGAYEYLLTYSGPNDKEPQILYSSNRVGGSNNTTPRVGLNQATVSLEEFFYLDSLKTGQKGDILLTVSLDGETQGNPYQDTLAQLQMNFAVELPSSRSIRRFRSVRTGDENQLLLWSAVMLGCGLAALGLGVYNFRKQNRRRRHEK